MADNLPARAMSDAEKTAFRSERQWSELGLVILDPPVVYTCRINKEFTSWDRVAEIPIDGGDGDIADVLPHMTCYVGSAEGTYDKGVCRVRKDSTSDLLYIGETSSIHFEDDDYLTIVDMPAIYPRDLTTDGGEFRMDYDIVFNTSKVNPPVPVLGPVATVAFRSLDAYGDPEPLAFHPLDPSESYSPSGATISSYLFACATGTVTDADTTHPTITFDSAGWHKWSCTIADSDGKTAVGYRWICVDPVSIDFGLASDWSPDNMKIVCSNSAPAYERALCLFYSKNDAYDGVSGTFGKLEGYERVEFIGWILEKSISQNAEHGEVQFSIGGILEWLDKVRGFPSGLTDATAPSNWVEVSSLTVDKALSHLFHWCTTADVFCDIRLTGDTKRVRTLAAPRGKLLSQIKAISEDTLLATPMANSLGQVFIEIDTQFLSDTDQAGIPVVLTLARSDVVGSVEFDEHDVEQTSFLEVSGIGAYDGSFAQPYFSHAPGSIGGIYGGDDAKPSLIFDDQAHCNHIAGRFLAIANAKIPQFTVRLGGNVRNIDVCPRQLVKVTIDPNSNSLGVGFENQDCIPRKVTRARDVESGEILVSITFEVLVSGTLPGVEYYPPQPMTETVPEYDTSGGGIGAFPPLSIMDFPEYLAGSWNWATPVDCKTATSYTAAPKNQFVLSWSKKTLYGVDDEEGRKAQAYFPCAVRMGSAQNSTSLILGGRFLNCSGAVHVYGMLSGSRVITGVGDVSETGGTFTFNPISAVDVDGFEIEIDEYNISSESVWNEDAMSVDGGTAIVTFPTPLTCHCIYTSDNGIGGVSNFYPFVKSPTSSPSYIDVKIFARAILQGNGDGASGQCLSFWFGSEVCGAFGSTVELTKEFTYYGTAEGQAWVSSRLAQYVWGYRHFDLWLTINADYDDLMNRRIAQLGRCVLKNVCRIDT